MIFTQAHTKFLEYLEVIKNTSPKTVEQYDRHLNKFGEFLGEKKSSFEVKDITLELSDQFRNYVHSSSKKQVSIKTANAYMITLRSFLKFLEKKGHPSLSPTAIDLIKAEDRQVEFLTQEELERIFAQPKTDTLIGARDIAIMETIYSTGLRISELTSLNISDINLERKEFGVRGKGRKLRVVYLTDRAVEVIQKYLQKRQDHFSPLFIRHNSKIEDEIGTDDEDMRLSRFFITSMIKKYAGKAFILKNVSAHTLRHSFATTLLGAGADIRSIQEMLGHASITTTQVYTHVTNPELKKIHDTFMK
ncbi:tyrosine-type recombinase/integrase [Candidatus Gracilibacteria bacterium]|nr:tyrosine-type recombinase/integrase [Candidatus Gracilibacteria bacterium]